MKIGYYLPCLKDLPVSGKNYRASSRRQEGFQPIKWESDEGLEFIESLFIEGNLSLPKYKEDAKIFGKESFKTLQDFFLVLKLYRTICQSRNLIFKLSRDYSSSLVSKLLDLKKAINNSKSNLEKHKSFQTKLDFNIGHFDLQGYLLTELIENLEEKILTLNGGYESYCHGGLSSFWDALEDPLWNHNSSNQDISIRGFKLSEETHEPSKLFSDLGYANDALQDDMKLLKEFNSKHRDNSCEILNKFYKVIRTNDPSDILYLSKVRSEENRNKIILVFKTNDTNKANPTDSDFVYFRKFHTNPKTSIISLIVSDGRSSGFAEEDKELNYGILSILDPKTKEGMKADHPIIQHLEKKMVKDYALEGFKLSNKIVKDLATGENTKLKWVETGVMGKTCSGCDSVPCVCKTIWYWENYCDPSDSGQTGKPYWGFSRELELEKGKPIKDIDTIYHDRSVGQPVSPSDLDFFYQLEYVQSRDEDGLDWSRYNDQLDMDQQDPDFW